MKKYVILKFTITPYEKKTFCHGKKVATCPDECEKRKLKNS